VEPIFIETEEKDKPAIFISSNFRFI